jgi:hypothetical protein
MLIAGICFDVVTLYAKETNQVDIADVSTSAAMMGEEAGNAAAAARTMSASK